MQTSKIKRLLAALMAAVMMLAAIPFTSLAEAADETTIKDYIVIGSYNDTALVWKILGKNADGNLVLISKDVIAKTKFGGTDFAAATIYTTLTDTFYNAAFTAEEKAAFAEMTTEYTAKDGAASVKGYITLPTKADVETYGLTKATLLGTTTNTVYWLADWSKTTAICTVTTGGTIGQTGNTAATAGYRPMITVKADSVVALEATEGVTYTVDGTEVTNALKGDEFKIVLDDNYSNSAVTVKADGTAIEAADGVYTATGAITVEGVQLNAADYEAYNAAVEATKDLSEEDYSAESWAALKEALAADVANLSVLDQDKVDAATAAINEAIGKLATAPADFTAYDAAVEAANYRLNNSAIYNLSVTPEGSNNDYMYLIKVELKKESTIRAYTKADQEKVDEAAATLAALVEAVPYKKANTTAWKNAVDTASKLNKDYYDNDYVDAVLAIIEEVVAEHDYVNDPVDIIYQADVDAATKRMTDVIGTNTDLYLLKPDFTALDAALELADAYLEENYYKDEDVERTEEKGGTDAWTRFAAAKASAQDIADNKDKYTTKITYQTRIDETTASLVSAMANLDQYIKLGKWDRFVKDVKYFFSDIAYKIKGFIDLMKTVFSLLGMLFRGEIDLYGLFEMLGVDQEVLDILIKIGIEPLPDEEDAAV